jgi:hypothetical protein
MSCPLKLLQTAPVLSLLALLVQKFKYSSGQEDALAYAKGALKLLQVALLAQKFKY